MKGNQETFLTQLRKQKCTQKNGELARRLLTPKSTEEMFQSLCSLKGLNVAEREAAMAAQEKELILC